MTELLTMSMKDLDRLKVIQTVLAGTLSWHEAAEHLTLSERQIGNVVARVRRDGPRGLVHRLRGRPSNRRLPPGLIQRAVALVQTTYPDFGPTFATEKLRERHGLRLSVSTLRRGMIQAGLWRPRGGRKPGIGPGGRGAPASACGFQWTARSTTGSKGGAPAVSCCCI